MAHKASTETCETTTGTMRTWRDVSKRDPCFARSVVKAGQRCDKPRLRVSCRQRVINRNCLTRFEHTQVLSTPRGYRWTGLRGLKFVGKIYKNMLPKHNGPLKKSVDDVGTAWKRYVTQFLLNAGDSLTQNMKIMLTKILSSKVNFSDSKWSNRRNTQTELCYFFRDLNPKCSSNKWKWDSVKTLSPLIFNYIIQVLYSDHISRKNNLTTMILKTISQINKAHGLKSTNKFLKEVQIFIANMLSPWLNNSITNICHNDSDLENKQSYKTSNRIKTIAAKGKTNRNKSKPNKLKKIKTDRLTESKENKKTKFKKFESTKSKKNNLSKSEKDMLTESKKDELTNPKSNELIKFKIVMSTKSKKDKLTKPKSNESIKFEKDMLRNSKIDGLTKPRKDDLIKSKNNLSITSKENILTNSKEDKLMKTENIRLIKSEKDKITKSEKDELSSERITKVHELLSNYKIEPRTSKKSLETKIISKELSQSKLIIHRNNKVPDTSKSTESKPDIKKESKISEVANENEIAKKGTESRSIDNNLKRLSDRSTLEITRKYKNTPEEKDGIENKNKSKKEISELNKNQPKAIVLENNTTDRIQENNKKITDSAADLNANDFSLILKYNENIIEEISNKSRSKILTNQNKTNTNRETETAIETTSDINLLETSRKSINDKLTVEINKTGKGDKIMVDRVPTMKISQQSNISNQTKRFKNITGSMSTRSAERYPDEDTELLMNKRDKNILFNKKSNQSTPSASKHSTKLSAEERFKFCISHLKHPTMDFSENNHEVTESRSRETNCFQRIVDKVQSMTTDEIRSELTEVSKKCAGNRGVNYQITIRDDSNYSLRKTMLPLHESNETINPTEKSNALIKKIKIKEDKWTFNLDKKIC